MERALARAGYALAAAIAAFAIVLLAYVVAGRTLSKPVRIAPLNQAVLAPSASPTESGDEHESPEPSPSNEHSPDAEQTHEAGEDHGGSSGSGSGAGSGSGESGSDDGSGG